MGLLRTLFGPSRAEIWQRLSTQLNADFLPGGLMASDRVVAHVGEWIVTLDIYSEAMGRTSIEHTRIRAPFVNHDGFRFRIHDRTMIDDIEKRFGLQDIEVGDTEFDKRFIIQGADADHVRAFLADAELRRLLLTQKSISFEIRDDEGWFGAHFPEGVDELCFCSLGVVDDLEELKTAYALFAEALHQLCRIGSAYENESAHS